MGDSSCCCHSHSDAVSPASISLQEMEDLSSIFKVLSDPTRLRIISALFQGEQCVGEISQQLEMTQSAISHQLRLLRSSHLVKTRRDGRMVYYSLDDNHVETIIGSGLAHVRHIDFQPLRDR